jgi:hypothetical protein
MRVIPWGYTILVAMASVYAWVVDIAMLHSEREHLLPIFILSIVTSPLSLSLGPLYDLAPSFFDLPFVQLTYTTVCGAVQAGLVLWLFRKS